MIKCIGIESNKIKINKIYAIECNQKRGKMKIERLYAITIYLLNHGKTSSSELAKYFEVSVRTIQRDIDSLCLAGIPIISFAGATGGYEISERFILEKQLATSDDYSYILTALQGLVSATNDNKAKQILEKICSISNSTNNGIILDFSVLREGDENVLHLLQSAVIKKRAVNFTYTNNDNVTRTHTVEPIAVLYRWYAWYLLAYSKVKDDYRIYKLVRMSGLKITDEPFVKLHESADIILKKTDKKDSRQYRSVTVKCKKAARSRVIEYLNGTVTNEFSNGDALMNLIVVENEQLWIGTLLSLGDNIQIIEPEDIRERIITAAQKIIKLYK